MADTTLTLVPWAPGTAVGAYRRRSEQLRPDGPPTGVPPTDTQIVAADASLTYDVADGEYWAAAPVNGSGTWRYVAFLAETPIDQELAVVDARLDAVEADDVTTDSRLDAIESSILYNAKKDGATGYGLVDEGAALNAAAANAKAAGKILVIDDGIYLTTAGVFKPPDDLTILAGRNAVIKPTGTTHGIIFGSPSATTPATRYALTVNGVAGAQTVTVSPGNSANFAVGQRVYLRDTTTLGGEQNHKEPNIVKSVNTSTGVVTLHYPLLFSYQIASSGEIGIVTVAKNIHWHGGKIDMTGVPTDPSERHAIYLAHGKDCSVNDLEVYNHPHKTVEIYAAINCHARRIIGHDPTVDGPGQGYNGRLSYSRHCTLDGGWGQGLRHTGDIAGGADCIMRGLLATGRTPSGGSQTAFYLHGLESRRCRVVDCHASNTQTGFGAGNGTFGADYDFKADVTSDGCDVGVALAQSCSGFYVKARALNSVDRAASLADALDGQVDIEADGQQSAANALITISGTSDRLVVRPRLKNILGHGIDNTASGEVTIEEPDIDMGTLLKTAVRGTSLPATATYTVHNGRIRLNEGTAATAVQMQGASGAVLLCEGTKIRGTFLRGVYFLGGAGDCTIDRVRFRGSGLGEQIRVDTGTSVKVLRVDFAGSGSGVRLNTAGAAYFEANQWNTVSTKINNSGGATLSGVVDVLTGTATWDPASTADGAMASTTVTVTGAAVGDVVTVGYSTAIAAGAVLTGTVTAANTVTVTLFNKTGAALDPASGTLRAVVEKRA